MEKINRHKAAFRKALILEYLTIVWNIFEGGSSMLVGVITGSVALFAYGLESSIEIFASGVVVWELRGIDQKREKLALKLIGFAYIFVSVYIFFDAARSLFAGHHADRSYLGIILMVVTAIIMGALGLFKKKAGQDLGSKTVLADAKFTLIDAALAGTVLVGLLFNSLFGWWWMDQAMALFLSGVAFREGVREIL